MINKLTYSVLLLLLCVPLLQAQQAGVVPFAVLEKEVKQVRGDLAEKEKTIRRMVRERN